jgi:hypothetical protein
LGVFCVLLFAVEKVLVDEVAHEWVLEGGAPGEWRILYLCLSVQMVYVLITIWKSARARLAREGSSPSPRDVTG